jgi:glycosyltransferase involved in cell wall biosynthesis
MRVVAVLAAYNEARFIHVCLDHLIRQGIDVYLIDNSSSDDTVAIASRFVGRGLIDIESCPREGQYSWRPLLERKERVFATVDADWVMHVDADEIRLCPPQFGRSLQEGFEAVERQGYNAINFLEFTFTPTREAPDHDHPDFVNTMRWYYPFQPPGAPSQIKAWKQQPGPVDLASSAGHRVDFPGVRVHPHSFPMRHYLFLSVAHAVRKYIERRYDPAEIASGWHRARAALRTDGIRLPRQDQLKYFVSDDRLDASNPRTRHYLFASEDVSSREDPRVP